MGCQVLTATCNNGSWINVVSTCNPPQKSCLPRGASWTGNGSVCTYSLASSFVNFYHDAVPASINATPNVAGMSKSLRAYCADTGGPNGEWQLVSSTCDVPAAPQPEVTGCADNTTIVWQSGHSGVATYGSTPPPGQPGNWCRATVQHDAQYPGYCYQRNAQGDCIVPTSINNYPVAMNSNLSTGSALVQCQVAGNGSAQWVHMAPASCAP